MKEIIISSHAGYCMGVKRAFSESFKLSSNNKDIYTYGEMVHNRFALKALEDNGIIGENNINDIISNTRIKNVIIRAHGIPPYEEKMLKDAGKNIFDYTCPIVKQVQLLAEKLTKENFTVIIFGKAKHPEVIGIAGYCKEPFYIINSVDDIDMLPFDKINKPALISQTTMNSNVFHQISEKLKMKYNELKICNTLCSSPLRIQDSALKLAKEVDLMIVVGDKMSANTTTLYEKIKKIRNTIFAETEDDINLDKLKSFNKIGITGGSSTPGWQMENIRDYILKNSR